MSARGALALCLLASLSVPGSARAAEFGLLALNCKGVLALDPDSAGEEQGPIAFDATVIFADGEHLALVDPQTQRSSRLLNPYEVTRGSLEIVGREPEPIVWTSATGQRATLIGFLVRSDSSLVTLTVRGPDADTRARPFVLFDSRSGAVHRGRCH